MKLTLWYCLYLDRRLEDLKKLQARCETQLRANLWKLTTKESFEFSMKSGYIEKKKKGKI